MMERVACLEINDVNQIRIKEILTGSKNILLVLETEVNGFKSEILFRPEDGMRLQFDPRIPIPQELYRDFLYHKIDKILGFNTTLPVIPLILKDGKKGVARPFLRGSTTLEPYEMEYEIKKNHTFWRRVAILDYVCAVTDRNYNDILIENDERYVVDSGLSFVEGIRFVYQNSIVRELIAGSELSKEERDNISDKKKIIIDSSKTILETCEVASVCNRINLLLLRNELL